MFYQKATSTDNFVKFTLGEICNITINNESLANSIDVSSDGTNVDIGTVEKNAVLTLDQNNFPYQTVYIKSTIAGSPAIFQIWGW